MNTQVASMPSGQNRNNSGSRPPIIILNMFYTGLGIARNLSSYGLRVLGLSADRKGYGHLTRSCEVRFAPNSHEEPFELRNYLLTLANEFSGAVIFPTRDADVLFLDNFRDELAPHFRLAIPSHEALMRVIDKASLVETAMRAGVAVPRTMVVAGTDDIALIAEKVGYPCVVKPVRSVDWRKGSNWETVGGRKAYLAENESQFREEYQLIAGITPELLVQEWIPGSNERIVIFGGYMADHGQPLAYFTARKLVQSPEDFGTGCIVESIAIPELLEPTVKLCRALDYHGMAEVEYKKDDRIDEYKLIEINTRHWDWHRLGMASNVNVSWAAYCDLAGVNYVAQPHVNRAAKWVAEDAILSYFLTGVYHRQIRLQPLFKKLSGKRQYGIFYWSDPLPFVHNFLTVSILGTGTQIWNKLFRK
jgi:D-aspartate ligase